MGFNHEITKKRIVLVRNLIEHLACMSNLRNKKWYVIEGDEQPQKINISDICWGYASQCNSPTLVKVLNIHLA